MPYTTLQDQATLPLLNPSFAELKKEKIELKNGLKALIISDPKLEKSAAVLTVNVGSWEDPLDAPGLAHFNEHMLFLGTTSYPEESEFNRFVTEHGGYTNAFTTDDTTAYMFSCDTLAFEEGLDRFSSFFKEPLFNPSGVSRELHAIDQEFAKNVENDDLREYYLFKSLANPDHPHSEFGMGNIESLNGVSRQTLIEWYKSHYSAKLMRLIVYSPKPLDETIALVVKDFDKVPSFDVKKKALTTAMFNGEIKAKLVAIKPIKDIRTLTLQWEIPSKQLHYLDTQPHHLVCHLIGHEGKESLLAELKKEKLAESLRCGALNITKDNGIFYIEVGLTDDGVKQYATVVQRIFETLALINHQKIPGYFYDEVHKMGLLSYQFQPRKDVFEMAMRAAGMMNFEPWESFPEKSMVLQSFNQEHTQELLDVLTPQNALYSLSAPPELTGILPNKKEKWLGAEYSILPLDEAMIQKWSEARPNPVIQLPPPNPYLPKNLDSFLKPSAEPIFSYPQPVLTLDSEKGKVYFAKDTFYQMPKVWIQYEIKTPDVNIGSPLLGIMADLFVKLSADKLSNEIYNAAMAGHDVGIKKSEEGFILKFNGYSDRAENVLGDVIKKITKLSISESEFDVYKDELMRSYLNASKDSPLKQASELMRTAIYKAYATNKAKAAGMKQVTLKRFQDYLKSIFKKTYVEGLIFGDFSKEQSEKLTDSLLNELNSKPFPLNEQKKPQVVILPEKQGPFFMDQKTQVQGNAALLLIQTGKLTPKSRAVQQLIKQALEEPFFAELRTRQQTGYLVFNTYEELEKELFLVFGDQSNTHQPRDLLARFELFFETYLREIKSDELPEARFETMKKVMLTQLNLPPKSLAEMGDLLQKFAFDYEGDFNWVTKRIEALNALSYSDFIDEVKNILGRNNRRRFAALITGETPDETIFKYLKIVNPAELRRKSTYTK